MQQNKQYTCIIIDDEPLAIKVIEEHLENFNNIIECIGTFTKPINALEILNNHKVDIVFLDINMPSISGIEFIKAIPKQPYVIFTTAYREFAVDAFDLNALDYLVKPISTGRFLKAINKFLALNQSNNTNITEHLNLKADKKNYKIPIDSIIYIESLDNYIKVQTTKTSLISYESLSALEKELPANTFMRIHRSYIINLSMIDHYTSSYVVLDDKKFTIGRNYKEEVIKRLEAD
jgi:DNA-binding LytR/AlgR family response regulator